MKFLGALTGVAIVALVAFLLWPKLKPQQGAVQPQGPGLPQFGTSGGLPPNPDKPMDPILSEQEKMKQEIATRRIPFFRHLHDNFGAIIENFAVTEEINTLDVVIAQEDDAAIKKVLEEAVGPSAKQYGFDKVRFFGRREQALKPLVLVAESTLDGSNVWTTFRK